MGGLCDRDQSSHGRHDTPLSDTSILDRRQLRSRRRCLSRTEWAKKYYVASDHLESSLYRAFAPNDLFDIVIRHGLHFDQAKQTGVLLHMLPTVGENGRFGVVAVANSPEDADERYERVQLVIQQEAERLYATASGA